MAGKVNLTDVCDIIYGYPFDSKKFNDSIGIGLIRIRDILRGFTDTYTTEECSKEYLIKKDDLLIGMDGEFNIAKWKGAPSFLNQRVCKLNPKNNIDKNYLFYRMPSLLKQIESQTPFVTVKHLSAKQLNSIQFLLPELDVQEKIAKVLSTVDLMLELRNRELGMLDLLVKSRFIEMFGDPVSNPKGWDICNLEEQIEFMTSGSRGWAKYFANDGFYFITIKNVKNSRITVDNIQHILPPENAEAIRTKVKENDILISITADLGRTGVVSKEIAEHGAYINQHLSCIRVNQERLNSVYVSYYMESEAGRRQFISKNQSAVKAGLNFDAIKSLKITLPPISLQNHFADFVQQVDKSKLAIQQSIEKLETLKKSLMQEYFG